MAQAMAYEGPIPPTVAGYRVDELVGVGGTGEVWRARDVLTGRMVALKRLRRDGPPAERDRLRREAAVLAGLTSPHIVRLVTVLTSADGLVLVLDYQGGGSLASLLHSRPVLGPGEVVTIAAPLAQALAEVHALAMVHGDISPANILFSTDGRPMLSDLGVARLAGGSGSPAVTAAFADPAVLDGAPFTPTSDVYALAAVCFTALTGTPPVAAPGLSAPSLAVLAPSSPPALIAVLDAALSAEATQRPDAATLAARLLEAAPAQPVRLAGATVPVDSPPTAAVRRLPPPVPRVEPVPSRAERLAAVLGRLRLSPRRVVASAAVPVAVGGAIWGGVAWARSTSAGAPAWTAGAAQSSQPVATAGPLGRPGAPDPEGGRATGAGAGSTAGVPAPSGSPRSGSAQDGVHTGAPAAVAGGGSLDQAGGGAAGTATAAASPPATAPAGSSGGSVASLTRTLRLLDSRRDAAFGKGSLAQLDDVYVLGSAPLREDRTLLLTMTSAGEHAVGLRLTVRRLSVVAATSSSADVRVTDTLGPYRLVSASGAGVPVAGRGEVTWSMRLTRTGGGWRIASITRAGADPTSSSSSS